MSRIFLRLNALPSPAPARTRAFERALARARRLPGNEPWRAVAFRTVAPQHLPLPGIAAAALFADAPAATAVTVWIATPVHCEAGLVSVRLPVDGLIPLAPPEAVQLAALFNQDFADSPARLLAGASGRLYCLLAEAVAAPTVDPQQVRGRDIADYLPAGAPGAPLRRLMSEVEMWLHALPFNAARQARGEPAITGLWLWGGGKPLDALPALSGWTAGEDPLFAAWRGPDAFPAHGGAGVIVIDDEPGSPGWEAAAAVWVEPAVTALHRGRVGELLLSVGGQLLSLRRRDAWRLWRRARPWWEWYE